MPRNAKSNQLGGKRLSLMDRHLSIPRTFTEMFKGRQGAEAVFVCYLLLYYLYPLMEFGLLGQEC